MSIDIRTPDEYVEAHPDAPCDLGTASNGHLRWATRWTPDQCEAVIAWLREHPDARLECCSGYLTAASLLERYIDSGEHSPPYSDGEILGALWGYGWGP